MEVEVGVAKVVAAAEATVVGVALEGATKIIIKINLDQDGQPQDTRMGPHLIVVLIIIRTDALHFIVLIH